MKKRSIALLMAVVMLFGATVGGTIAWLKAESETVTNTFTFGDVSIVLDESKLNTDGTLDTATRVQRNEYKLIPGRIANKDPMVTVGSNSEDCYVFVKITEKNNTFTGTEAVSALAGKIINYTVGEDWTKVAEGVYVYGNPTVVKAGAELKDILSGNTVTVNSDLTKEQSAVINTGEKPTLEFVAYAIQADSLPATATTPAAIWALINS